jgi:hypothetical protein
MRIGVLALVVSELLVGCADAMPLDESSLAINLDPEECDPNDCVNAASVADLLVHTLDASPQHRPNDAQMRVVSFKRGDRDVMVLRDRLAYRDDKSALLPTEVPAVVLRVVHPSSGIYNITFPRMVSTDYWVGASGQTPLYEIVARRDGETGLPRAVCRAPLSRDPDWSEIPMGMALLFEGDRYNVNDKTVYVPPVPEVGGWFNIACSGYAMAKLHLLRHTSAGKDPNRPTSQDQRQAMLKMLTDDVCGDGTSYTVNGEHILYMDRNHLSTFNLDAPSAGTTEAIWSKDGALCLTEARRELEHPGTTAGIRQHCAVQECTALMRQSWFGVPGAYAITVNPAVTP